MCVGYTPYLREMVKMKKYQAIAGVIVSLMVSVSAHAEDSEEIHVPSRAVWIEPMDSPAPWLDTRVKAFSPAVPEIVSTGGAFSVARLADGRLYAVDKGFSVLGEVVLPEGARWFSVDAGGRVLAYNGAQILAAPDQAAAARADGFSPILDAADVRAIDMAGGTLVYADAANVSLVALDTGTIRRIALADFFDDAKVASMTPDAVANAEKSKKKSKSKQAAKSADAQQVADIQGIYWRGDGVGVLVVRSLLNKRTFVTADNGRSWRQMSDAPETLRHSFGWIWDGQDRVLSRDGTAWVRVNGAKISPADRWTLSHVWADMPGIPADWISRESPEQSVAGETGDAEPVAVGWIPEAVAQSGHGLSLDTSGLYAPTMPHGGFDIGLYRRSAQDVAEAWSFVDGRLASTDLPEGCQPMFVAGVSGIGIAFCRLSDEEFTVYTRSAQKADASHEVGEAAVEAGGLMPWVAETILPAALGIQPTVYVSEDGTLVLRGACEKFERQVPVMPDDDALAMGVEPETEVVVDEQCRVAVRMPAEIGMSDIWRLESLAAQSSVVPLTYGRLVSVEPSADGMRKLVLRTSMQTEEVAENFDPGPYQGLVSTANGCLALYDGRQSVNTLRSGDSDVFDENGTVVASNVKLLSTDGRLAELDCASSQAIVESGSENAYRFEEPRGEDRFGLRASGGAFFALKDVITWFARIEGLVPIYSGQYEVSLVYRMSGGNMSGAFGHLGLLSIRWRYNDLELFDFAVGAGIGYGMTCGYDKSKDPGATDDDDSTKPSGFSECGVASMQYEISGFAAYKLAEHWKLFVSAHLLGGENWGFDLAGGVEVRF